jgi:hypothetical protein
MHNATNISHVDATEEWLDIGMPRWREDDAELVTILRETRRRLTTRDG